MAEDKKYKKKIDIEKDDEDSDSSGEGGAGGRSGEVEFRDFLSSGENLRDDLLPPEERKRLLSVHQSLHEAGVKKQKALREQRKALKEGKISTQKFQQGLPGAGMNNQYKVNPILANKAQFSGIDRQVNLLPTENIAETNQDKREELQYQHRYTPENTPRFIPPKLQPR